MRRSPPQDLRHEEHRSSQAGAPARARRRRAWGPERSSRSTLIRGTGVGGRRRVGRDHTRDPGEGGGDRVQLPTRARHLLIAQGDPSQRRSPCDLISGNSRHGVESGRAEPGCSHITSTSRRSGIDTENEHRSTPLSPQAERGCRGSGAQQKAKTDTDSRDLTGGSSSRMIDIVSFDGCHGDPGARTDPPTTSLSR